MDPKNTRAAIAASPSAPSVSAEERARNFVRIFLSDDPATSWPLDLSVEEITRALRESHRAAESAAYALGLERAARMLDGDAGIADECGKDEVRSADQVRLYYRACVFREAAEAIRALAGSEEPTTKEKSK